MKRYSRLVTLVLSTCLVPITAVGGETILWDRVEGNYRSAAIIVPPTAFSEDSAMSISDRFLRSSSSRIVAKIELATDKESELPRIAAQSYSQWLLLRRNSAAGVGGFAEIVRTPFGSVVRLRGQTNNIVTKVLNGMNPLKFEAANISFDVLWLSLGPPVQLFIRAERLPDLATARAANAEFASRFGPASVECFIRTDSWFADHVQFPLWFPFALPSEPPSAKEWADIPAIECRPETFVGPSCNLVKSHFR
jgi:hypothetical protein